MEELNELINELVVKRGPYTGYIKKDQDPDKVSRLLELGYNEPVKAKEEDTENIWDGGIQERLEALESGQKQMQKQLDDHKKKIAIVSIRR